jgi:probable HAF family extracellular repeat protein
MRRISYALALVAVCGCSADTPIAPAAVALAKRPPTVRYTITKLASPLGGNARGMAINNRGWVAGFSNLSDNFSRHAVLWRNADGTDLNTLGGPNSTVQWPGLNDSGVVVGLSETADLNPLNESWSCSAFFPSVTKHICLGFVYESGGMRALPTLGGYNGFAAEVNNRGQIVGWTETPVHDPTCVSPQVLQFRAVMWEPGSLTPHELPPLTGDSTSAATAINDRGQVVGISGRCDVAVGEFSAQHSVIWENGHPTRIPDFGGAAWNTPVDINNAGDVTGFSDFPGDDDGTSNFQGFFWSRKTGLKKIGVLPGDEISQPFAINAQRQVVGISCGEVGCHSFLWQNDVLQPFDSLVVPGFGGNILSTRDINDDGTITGDLFDSTSKKRVAFIATPTR